VKGCLCVRAGVREGRTVLLESQGTYPLQAMRPHPGPGLAGLSLVVLHLSAGLLDGDELSIEVNVEPGARLALRTQAALQVHAGRSRQTLHATVADGGWFSYVPHALVPHADADHLANTVVRMEPGARVLVADALSPGRVEHGEYFAYTQVRLHLDVWRGSDLLARERALVRPDPALRLAQFGRATHTAAAYAIGPGDAIGHGELSPSEPGPRGETRIGPGTPARELSLSEPEPCSAIQIGRTELARGGWYLRATAHRAVDLDDALARLSAQWWQSCEVPKSGRQTLGDLPV
jgi:urease accessory protein